MSNIDERIVSMQFDNANFEKNVNSTMTSLNSLDETIDNTVKNSGKSFIDLENGISRLDMVFAGFYHTIGGYLADLTMKAGRFAKSLSIDQLSAGFEKYTAETQAVQTIVSNTDEGMEHTYKILEDILKYTDETSYHYDKLTNTMASFANTGVKLDDAALAVKGIANWAAISGAGIDRADFAMDALVKSISSGKMQLQEWNTIQKVARMGNKSFVDLLIKTGEEMGKLEKGTLTYENFRNEAFGTNALIDAELLLTVLQKYGDDTQELGRKAKEAATEAKTFAEAIGAVKDAVSTGWLLSFRHIFGDYEEGKRVWTGIQDAMLEVFTIGQKYRNEVLKIWHDKAIDGYKSTIESIATTWAGIRDIAKEVGVAFHEVFGFENTEIGKQQGVKYLNNITNALDKLSFKANMSTDVNELVAAYERANNVTIATNKGKQNVKDVEFNSVYDELAEKALRNRDILNSIYAISSRFFDVISSGIENLKQFKDGLHGMFDGIGPVIQNTAQLADNILLFVRNLSYAAEQVNFFERIGASISKVIHSILGPAFEFISKILETFGIHVKKSADDIDGMKNVLDKIAKAFETVADTIVGKAIAPAVEMLGMAFAFLKEKLEPLKGILTGAKDAIIEFVNGFKGTDTADMEKTASTISNIGSAISSIFDVVGKVLEKVINYLKQFFTDIDINKVLTTIRNVLMNGLLIMLINFVKNLDWISSNLESITRKMKKSHIGAILFPIALSLLALAAAMAMIAAIPTENLTGVTVAIVAMMGEISGMILVLDKFQKNKSDAANLRKTAVAMSFMAGAIVTLAKAVQMLGIMKTEDLIKGGVAVTVLLGALTGISKVLSDKESKRITKGASSLILMAAAIDILVIAIKALGKLDMPTLAKGLGSVVILLASFAGMAKLMNSAGIKASTGFAILEIAVAMNVLAAAIKSIGSLDANTLINGIVAIAGSLALIGVALQLFPEKGMISTSTGLILVSVALEIIADVLKKLGAISPEDLAKSIIAMGSAIAVLGAALNAAKNGILGAVAIDLMVVALIPLVAVLKVLGNMQIAALAKGIISLGLALAVMATAVNAARGAIGGAIAIGIIATSMVPFALAVKLLSEVPILDLVKGMGALLIVLGTFGILAPALAVVLPVFQGLGSSIMKMGIGIAALSAALVVLNILGPAAIGLISELITAFVASIPEIAAALGKGLVEIFKVLTDSISVFGEFAATLVVTILEVLIAAIPKFVELGVTLLTSLLDGLIQVVPKVIELGVTTLIALLDAIIALVPKIVETGITIIGALLDGIVEMIPMVVEAGFQMIISFLEGIADSIRRHHGDLLAAGFDILVAIWEGIEEKFKEIWGKIKEKGGEIIKGIKEGLDEKINLVKEWILDLPNKIKEWFKEKVEEIKEAGGNIIEGIKDGLSGKEGGLMSKISGIGSSLVNKFKNVLGIKSPSRVFTELGGYIDEGLANGITKFSNAIDAPVENLADRAVTPMQAALEALSNIDLDSEVDPVIRPVLDLSEIQNGSKQINNMLGDSRNIGFSTLGIQGLSFAGAGGYGFAPITINVYGAEGQSVEEIADAVSRKFNSQFKQRSNVWK